MLNVTRRSAMDVTGERTTKVTVSPSMIRRLAVSSRQVCMYFERIDLLWKIYRDDTFINILILFYSSKIFLPSWRNECSVQDADRNVRSGHSFNSGGRDDSVFRDL